MSNEMKYWIKGLPVSLLEVSGNEPGTMKYWNKGLPLKDLDSLPTPPASTSRLIIVMI